MLAAYFRREFFKLIDIHYHLTTCRRVSFSRFTSGSLLINPRPLDNQLTVDYRNFRRDVPWAHFFDTTSEK